MIALLAAFAFAIAAFDTPTWGYSRWIAIGLVLLALGIAFDITVHVPRWHRP